MNKKKEIKKIGCPLSLDDEIVQLKFEISVLHKGHHHLQEKIAELEMLIRGGNPTEKGELQ